MEPKYATDARRRINNLRLITNPVTNAERVKLTVENIGKGALIELRGARFLVKDKNRYEETWKGETDIWYELVIMDVRTGEQIYLEFLRDDELELSIWHKKLGISELGLNPHILANMDDDEEGEFDYNGLTYEYDDSGDTVFFKGDGDDGEEYYYWDFIAEEDKSQLIGVEKWGDSYEAGTGEAIAEGEVVILAKGA